MNDVKTRDSSTKFLGKLVGTIRMHRYSSVASMRSSSGGSSFGMGTSSLSMNDDDDGKGTFKN